MKLKVDIRRFVILVCVALMPSFLFAQRTNKNFEKKSEILSKAIKAAFKPDSTAVSEFCERGCIFVKFRFDKKGMLPSIAFSNNRAFFINVGIKQAINELQKKAQTQVSIIYGKNYILPVVYDYELGCKRPKIDMTIATKEDRYMYLLNLMKEKLESENYVFGLMEMLDFNGTNKSAVDCILLSPLGIGPIPTPDY